ncbi:biotin/lipoyl-binding protein [Siminovitchia sp. FSL H7-0308]|uniref:biotin/lipoyl-binding protein n=1 Tax=Siminovitchia sp. FSL H7-0308 TaxID=2921432 RepID=UPI0030EB6611
MQKTVVTPGTLKLESEQYIYDQPEKGEVKEIFVKPGDKLKKGDKLLEYNNQQVKLEKRQHQLQINSIYLELGQIKKQHEMMPFRKNMTKYI